MRCLHAVLLAILFVPGAAAMPLRPDDICGSGRTCRQVVTAWNQASWDDLADESFNTSGTPMASVRWYTSEGTGYALRAYGSNPLNAANHQFYGVTDELGNVLLSHALGDDQGRFTKLRNFIELLRDPRINNLQCWVYYIGGQRSYTSSADVCVPDDKTPPVDSASDASLRILGAYSIACAKQRAGIWRGGPDFCADYSLQGRAITTAVTSPHGEVKQLADGKYYLSLGYRNWSGVPTDAYSFRPDYYELQFLMDYAVWSHNTALQQGVIDMLTWYDNSLGVNHIHRGKVGRFDPTYTCTELCSPAYMDNIDTWRAVPALSGLLTVHAQRIPPALRSHIFDFWWSTYGSPYAASAAKPFEIYSDNAPAVKQTELSYKTYGMWIPLAVSYDSTYVRDGVRLLTEAYDWSNDNFYTAAYYGGYYSQFAQRAIGAATGLLDPSSYAARRDFNADGQSDVLWWNRNSGQLVIWFLNNGHFASGASMSTMALPWQVAGVADFDGNGTNDLLWRNPVTGQNAIVLLNGTAVQSTVTLPGATTNWVIEATGDLTGDGQPDIIWHDHTSGIGAVWQMQGTVAASSMQIQGAVVPWHIAGAADFNRDGSTDLLWRNAATGQDVFWQMSGTTAMRSHVFDTVGVDWRVVAVADYDNDGTADLYWHNTTSGASEVWSIQNFALASAITTDSLTDTTWEGAGPR